MAMTWQQLGRVAVLGGALTLPVIGGQAVLAQAPVDPALEGRVLRRTDGALFLYRDGLRYGIVPAQWSDAQIDAIPAAASFDTAVAGLVGQTLRTCGLLGVPVDIVVQQAEPLQGIDGVLHAVVVANITNVGNLPASVSLPVELRDDHNRYFRLTSAGLNPDLTVLARQYGINMLTQQELEPGLTERQLWTFEVPPDVQSLTLVPDAFSRCDGMVAP
jgi:hypothetical protein